MNQGTASIPKLLLSVTFTLLLGACISKTPPPPSVELPPSEQNAIGADNDSYGLYNINTAKKISGEILEVKQVDMGLNGKRLDIVLQCSDGKILVYLGPVGYLKKSGIELKKGDAVTAKGSETVFNNSIRLIASELIKGTQKYQLRDKRGMPLWPESGKKLLDQQQLKIAE